MNASYLPELRDLAERLDFSQISKETYSPSIVKMDMIKGTSLMFGLLNEPNISCAKQFVSMGSVFPHHHHEEKECIIVYEGMMVINVGGEEFTLRQGGCTFVEPGVEHFATFPESDCWFLAVTIPQTEGWPAPPKGV